MSFDPQQMHEDSKNFSQKKKSTFLLRCHVYLIPGSMEMTKAAVRKSPAKVPLLDWEEFV